jgi:uncharacterized protein
MHYLLFYEFVPDYLPRRAEFRTAHLAKAWESHARGELILGGAYADPVDGALLLFKCGSRTVPENFAASDPYVLAGLVTRWRIREWTTVAGHGAITPVFPEGLGHDSVRNPP